MEVIINNLGQWLFNRVANVLHFAVLNYVKNLFQIFAGGSSIDINFKKHQKICILGAVNIEAKLLQDNLNLSL